MNETKTTTATTPPAKWYDSPGLKYLAGVVLSVALALLAGRFGVTPQPMPFQQAPTVLVLSVGPPLAAQPAIPVSGK